MRINLSETEGAVNLGMKMEELRAVKLVGKGSKGTVFLVQKQGCDKPLAFKAMRKSVMKKETDGMKRVLAEKEILRSLRHPFLPTLVGYAETEKIVGWVIDYCPGGDLNVLRRNQSDKIFSESIIRFYAAEIVLALEHLHSLGVVYRDLKPENVLLQADGHIMLTDFDLSTTLPSSPMAAQGSGRECQKRHGAFALMTSCMTSSKFTGVYSVSRKSSGMSSRRRMNSFVGTEEYVSPEMLKGEGHDFAVDWWAVGVMLYEMLYGRTPFKGVNRKETFYRILVKQPHFSSGWTPLHDLIQRLLIKEPHNRLGSRNGAQEIKAHVFFRGLDWESVESVSRAPFIPPPVSVDDTSGMESINVEQFLNRQMELKDAKKMNETEDFTVF